LVQFDEINVTKKSNTTFITLPIYLFQNNNHCITCFCMWSFALAIVGIWYDCTFSISVNPSTRFAFWISESVDFGCGSWQKRIRCGVLMVVSPQKPRRKSLWQVVLQ